jgi:RNA polymerase primary sigma factor
VPRLPSIRLRALDDLARELRFAPRSAASRHIAAVLELATEIDPARAYGQDWVEHRITGYRKKSVESLQLVGEALLADLGAFAERLSGQSKLESQDLGQELLGLRALRARWDISPRTIERYRRKGLIGLRVRAASGRLQLMFPMSNILWFERASGARLAGAREYTRLTPEGQDRIVRAALHVRSESARSLTRVSAAVGEECGVSAEVARAVLRAHNAFAPPARLDNRQRKFAFRAWVRGVGPAGIAGRLRTTRATVHRLINAERAAMLRSLELEGPTPPRTAKSGGAILGGAMVREGLGDPGDSDAAKLATAARVPSIPDPERERSLAQGYHVLRSRARDAIEALPRTPGGTTLDRIETDLRRAALLKVELIRGERALIVRTIEERAGVGLLELPPSDCRHWLAVAFAAASEAVDRFDPFKRGRLAAPVSLALARSLAGLKPVEPGRRAHASSVPIDDWSRRVAPWQWWLDAPI